MTEPNNYEARIVKLEEKVETMGHRLFGNGQPGILDRLSEKVDKIDGKVGKLMLTVVGLAGGSGFGLAKLIEWLA
jgi:hypothetical protein